MLRIDGKKLATHIQLACDAAGVANWDANESVWFARELEHIPQTLAVQVVEVDGWSREVGDQSSRRHRPVLESEQDPLPVLLREVPVRERTHAARQCGDNQD